ncbi:hypothetical protein [Arthrobacter sp. H35-D1]|uniref:hypothetical protein n=1 Tax=Arthrobacter sp. H35-D1 TaxID=3046202 RepID=UPI0024B8BE54|nr:hypothetical protein [Arthrobacter sp. H35-D1]MDJ0311659.1 hypothetical protein [Arthrobacter sp. H35-D1]
MLGSLDIAQIIDDVLGSTDPVRGISVGQFLAIAALNRVVAACSRARIADWWATTAGPRFTNISAAKLGHRRFWDAMNQLTPTHLEDVSARITARIVKDHDLDTSTLALDMTNFATWVDTNNDAASLPSQAPRSPPETARWRPATRA